MKKSKIENDAIGCEGSFLLSKENISFTKHRTGRDQSSHQLMQKGVLIKHSHEQNKLLHPDLILTALQ